MKRMFLLALCLGLVRPFAMTDELENVPSSNEQFHEKLEQGVLGSAQSGGPSIYPIIISGGGMVSGGGTLAGDVWGPRGALTVSGTIPVTGPGVSGEAEINGSVHVTRVGWSNEVSGCETISGSVELKDAGGSVVGMALVSGQACVFGQARGWQIPYLGWQWFATVQGNVTVSGSFSR